MGLPELCNELVDLYTFGSASGELAHLRQPTRGEPVVLGAGFDQLVLNKTLVDRQDGKRVDLLVCLRQLAPGVVAVEAEE